MGRFPSSLIGFRSRLQIASAPAFFGFVTLRQHTMAFTQTTGYH